MWPRLLFPRPAAASYLGRALTYAHHFTVVHAQFTLFAVRNHLQTFLQHLVPGPPADNAIERSAREVGRRKRGISSILGFNVSDTSHVSWVDDCCALEIRYRPLCDNEGYYEIARWRCQPALVQHSHAET